jgi:signal transduction histidine kinase
MTRRGKNGRTRRSAAVPSSCLPLIEAFGAPAALVGAGGRTRFVSAALRKVLGLGPETPLQARFSSHIAPAHRPAFGAELARARAGATRRFETEALGPAGHLVPLSATATPAVAPGGEPAVAVVFALVGCTSRAGRPDRKVLELEALVAILSAVSAARGVGPTCQVAADRVAELLGFAGVAIYIESRGGAELKVAAVAGRTTLEIARRFELPDTALYRRIQRTGEIFCERRLGKNPLTRPYARALEASGFRGIVAVPLGPAGRIRGVLTIGAARPDDIDADTLRLLSDIGRSLGIAIEKAELVESMRRQLADTQLVRDVSAEVAGTLALGPLFQRVARSLARLIDVPQCFVLLHQPETAELAMVASNDPRWWLKKEVRLPVEGVRSSAVEAWRTRKTIAIPDCAKDPRVHRGLVRIYREKSLLAVPLIAGDQAIGVLMLAESRYHRNFQPDEIARVETVANHAALAIDNARRHQEAIRVRDRAELLLDVVRAASASVGLRECLETIASRLVRLSGAAQCVIAIPDEAAQRIVDVVHYGLTAGLRDVVGVLVGRHIEDWPMAERWREARRPIVIEDVSKERILSRKTALRYGLRAVLLVPVRSEREGQGRLVALVALAYAPEAARATEEEVELADAVARQVALSVANARAFDEIARQQRALDLLSARMIGAQEDERRRIARDLHDGVSQALSGIKLMLERLQKRIGAPVGAAGEGGPPLDPAKELARAAQALGDTVREIRRLCMDLRPLQLDHLGFAATVRWYAKAFAERTGIAVSIAIGEDIPVLTPEMEINLYRIVQEALSNVSRHARARRAEVRVSSAGGRLEVLVADDGCGFDPARVERREDRERGMGILTMGERAHLLGGEVRIRSREGRGTRVEVSVPIAPAPREAARA